MEMGEKLKSFRKTNGLTLKDLAAKVGCTDSYLSQIERGKVSPSIATLKQIADSLNVRIVDFFIDQHSDNDIVTSEDDRIVITQKRWKTKICQLVKNVRNKRMQPFYTTIQPGGGSKEAYSHPGEEFGLVLKGELTLTVDGKSYKVKENESFYISSVRPHSWINQGKVPTVVVWVVSPPSW